MTSDYPYPAILKSYDKTNDQNPPVVAIARQVDDVVNSVVGISPVEPLLNIVRDIMPANVVRTLTGLKKPSEIINPTIDEIAEKLRSKATEVKPPR